jgi:hypothetical protein
VRAVARKVTASIAADTTGALKPRAGSTSDPAKGRLPGAAAFTCGRGAWERSAQFDIVVSLGTGVEMASDQRAPTAWCGSGATSATLDAAGH